MKNKAALKICVLGGRSFGKTSLLSSLISISGDDKAGITVSGDNLKKLNAYNDYKNNNGKLIATSWDDICNFRYNITGAENKKWNVTFVDYPGEFFQKFFTDDENNYARKLLTVFSQKARGLSLVDNTRSFSKEELKQARKLARELEQADAFIVLLPADITKDIYKLNLDVFKTRLEALLENVQKINPYVPVCLAINKWDMFGKEYTELDSILQTAPYLDFHLMLKRELKDNYFCQSISAFGGNKSNGNVEDGLDEWDGTSRPINVLDMLVKLSTMAESSRYKYLHEQYEAANKVSRTIKYPFVFAKHYAKGANSFEERKFCVKEFVKCSFQLAVSCIVILAVCFVLWASITTYCEYRYLDSISAELNELTRTMEASSEYPEYHPTKEMIEAFYTKLDGHPVKMSYWRDGQWEKVHGHVAEIEDQYNQRIYRNAIAECKLDKNTDRSPQTINSKERLVRLDKRVAIMTDALGKLTNKHSRIAKREISEILQSAIIGEGNLRDNIKKYSPLYDKLFETPTNEEELCAFYESIISEFRIKFPEVKSEENSQQSLYVELEEKIKTLENKFNQQLEEKLSQMADPEPSNQNYEHRIKLAEQRKNEISRTLGYLSSQSLFKEKYKKLLSKEEQLIGNICHDRAFYEAYNTLLEDLNSSSPNIIKNIKMFLNTYTLNDYIRCEKYISELKHRYDKLIMDVDNILNSAIEENKITEDLPAKDKVLRTKKQIEAYTRALAEYPNDTEQYTKANLGKADLELKLTQYEIEANFEAEVRLIIDSENDGKLGKIKLFRDKYSKDVYPTMEKFFVELDEVEALTLNYWLNYKQRKEDELNDDEQLPLITRLSNVDTLITTYRKLLSEFLPTSEEYENVTRELAKALEKEKLIRFYKSLVDDFNNISIATPADTLNSVYVFKKDHIQGDYPLAIGVDIFTKLEELRKQNEQLLLNEYLTELGKNIKPSEFDFTKLSTYYGNCQEVCNKYLLTLIPELPIAKKIKEDRENYAREEKTNLRFAVIASKINELTLNDGLSSSISAKAKLNEIKMFLEQYPRIDNAELQLEQSYYRLTELQRKVEEYLGNECISPELLKIANELSPGATEEQKLENWKKQIDLIDEYLPCMIADKTNPLYSTFFGKLTELQTRFDDTEFKKIFAEDYEKVKNEIEELADPQEKIGRLRFFIEKYYDKELVPCTTAVAWAQGEEKKYLKEIKFNEFVARLESLLSKRPTEIAPEYQLTDYRDEINAFQEELKEYEQSFVFNGRAKDISKQLETEIAFVIKAIGDGSWKNIVDREKEYKNEPSDTSLSRLESALRKFDENTYAKFKDKVEEVKQNLEIDKKLYKRLRDTFNAFSGSPDYNSFSAFKAAVEDFELWCNGTSDVSPQKKSPWQVIYNSNYAILKKYADYIKKIQNGYQVSIAFRDTTFDGSWKKMEYELSTSGTLLSQGTVYHGGANNYTDTVTVTLAFGGSLACKIKYSNIAAYEPKSVTVDYWEILKRSMNSTSFDYTFEVVVREKLWGCDPDYYNGSARFSFFKLPNLK